MNRRVCGAWFFLILAGCLELQAQDYRNYSTPAACVGAVHRVHNAATWDRELADSLPYDATAGLAPAAIEAARQCGARFFSGEGRAKLKDTDGLFLLALPAGDDSLAATALREALSRQVSKQDSVDVLAYASFAFGGARPARLSQARATNVTLDGLGYLGDDLKTSWWSTPRQQVLYEARARMDSAALVGESAALLATIGGFPRDEVSGPSIQYAVHDAISADLPWALRAHGVDSAVARVLARAKAALGPAGFADSSLGQALTILGEPVPMPQPDFWFNRPPADTTVPRKGRVTLFQLTSAACTWCNSAPLRRVKARFGDSLHIVLMASTTGRIGAQFTPDPKKEAEAFRDILLGTQGIDATLAVWITKFDRLPDPDRRLRGQPLPGMMQYLYGGGGLLVDQRGVAVATVSANSSRTEKLTVSLIEALLKR